MKRIILPYIILILTLLTLIFIYRHENNLYPTLCSSLYYVFIYTPIYLYAVSRCVSDVYEELFLLRIGSRFKNSIYFLLRIIMVSIIFGGTQSLIIIMINVIKGNIQNYGFLWSLLNVLGTIVGWIIVGSIFAVCKSLLKTTISILITWLFFVGTGLSTSVLFGLGRYIYNIYSIMLNDERFDFNNWLCKTFEGILIIFVLGIVTFYLQKRKDILS